MSALQITANRAARARPAYSGQKLGSPARPQGIPNAHRIAYSQDRTVVVVEGATLATFVAGIHHHDHRRRSPQYRRARYFLLGTVLATHALPFFVGMTGGIYSFQTGAGPFGAIVVGFVTAGFTLVVGQCAFSVARSPIVRLVIGLLFAVPAARAGYDVTLALAYLSVPGGWWRESFAVLGAIAVGGTAWAHVSMQTDTALRPGATLSPIQPPNGPTTTGG